MYRGTCFLCGAPWRGYVFRHKRLCDPCYERAVFLWSLDYIEDSRVCYTPRDLRDLRADRDGLIQANCYVCLRKYRVPIGTNIAKWLCDTCRRDLRYPRPANGVSLCGVPYGSVVMFLRKSKRRVGRLLREAGGIRRVCLLMFNDDGPTLATASVDNIHSPTEVERDQFVKMEASYYGKKAIN